MPGADDVFTVERAFAQGPAHVVAHTGDRAELAVLADQRNLLATEQHLLQWLERQLIGCTDVDPRVG